jgi:tetratricopeptide (TPR) repeat protein
MPRTPTKQVTQLSPLQPARATAGAFGAAEGAALSQAGSAVSSLGGNLADIADRKDAYIAKNKYLDARKQADAFVTLQLNKDGENAFESAVTTEEMMSDIETKAIEGMTPRQQNIFMQNWKPSSIANTQRVSQHEMSQRKVADTRTNKALLETEARSFAGDGSRLSYEKSIAALKNLHSGDSQEVYDNAKTKLDEGLAKARFGTLLEIGDYDGAQAYIDRGGAPVSDLEGAPDAEALFGDSTSQLMQAELNSARRDAVKRREDEAARLLNEGNATIAARVARSGDPYYIPPVGDFAEAYSDREIAQFQHDQYVARVEKQKREDETGALTAEANRPDVSNQNVSSALQVASGITSGASTVQEASAALESLRFDKSEMAKTTRNLLADGINNVLSGRSSSVDNYTLQMKAEYADMFNKVNDKAVFGWFRQAIPGEVEVDDKGRVTTANQATRYFNQYLAGWDSTVKAEQAKLDRSMTIPEVEALGEQYFGKMKEWKSRDDFTRNAVTTIKSLYEAPYQSIPDAEDVLARVESLANSISARVGNGEE